MACVKVKQAGMALVCPACIKVEAKEAESK